MYNSDSFCNNKITNKFVSIRLSLTVVKFNFKFSHNAAKGSRKPIKALQKVRREGIAIARTCEINRKLISTIIKGKIFQLRACIAHSEEMHKFYYTGYLHFRRTFQQFHLYFYILYPHLYCFYEKLLLLRNTIRKH